MRARLLLRPLLLVGLALAACAHRPRVDLRPGAPLPVQAAAIYPMTFRWDEPAHRSFELSELLALQAMQTDRYAVFGPGEFRLLRQTSDNPFIGSDLALGLADRGIAPTQAIVFRPWAERRIQSAYKEVYDARGKPMGRQRVEETQIVARLEVFHSASREILAVVTETIDIDPLVPRDSTDPLPELTERMTQMMAAALDAIEERAPGERLRRDPGFTWLWNPRAALEYATEGRPALVETLHAVDPLEQELLIDARLRFFHPNLDDATAGRLKRLPGGLYITEVGPSAQGVLQPGDLIVEIEGEPALPQVLHRAMRRASPDRPVPMKVRRNATIEEIALPLPKA